MSSSALVEHDRMIFLEVEHIGRQQTLLHLQKVCHRAEKNLDGGYGLYFLLDGLEVEILMPHHEYRLYQLLFVFKVLVKRFFGNVQMTADVVHRGAAQSVFEKQIRDLLKHLRVRGK